MPEIGLFGKIPAEGDFVRYNAESSAAQAFERWLIDTVGTSGIGRHPIRAIVTPPESDHALLAVLVPSTDKSGHSFPLGVFAAFRVTDGWASLPYVFAGFLDAAVQLGRNAGSTDFAALCRAADQLSLPSEVDRNAAGAVCERALSKASGSEIVARLFDSAESRVAAHRQFLTGCTDESSGNGLFECPMKVDVDLFYWVELASRASARAKPQMYWTEDPNPRLLLGLGEKGMNSLPFFADAKRVDGLVKLTVSSPAEEGGAIGEVFEELSDDTSLGDLIAKLTQAGSGG